RRPPHPAAFCPSAASAAEPPPGRRVISGCGSLPPSAEEVLEEVVRIGVPAAVLGVLILLRLALHSGLLIGRHGAPGQLQ
ncbi:Zinc ribbon domain-containing protein, partial [Dysosmobacter welbionis]